MWMLLERMSCTFNEPLSFFLTSRVFLHYYLLMLFVFFLRVDIDNMFFTVQVELPNIFVEGKYEIDGKILLLPLRGSGPLKGNFSDCIGIYNFI